MSVAFKIASILVHGYVRNTGENVEDIFDGLRSFLKFEVFVPERMSKKVEPDTICTTLKQSRSARLVLFIFWRKGGEEQWG